MPYLLNNESIKEESINIGGIPCIRLVPRIKKETLPTIIFYHGWGSSKEGQRLRAFIVASMGYQVLIPDCIYHGERGLVDYNSVETTAKHFWEIILSNMDEFPVLMEDLVNKYNASIHNIGVMGHSMGGFTSAGIFTHNKNIKTVVVLNGSFNWKMSNEIFSKQLPIDFNVTGEGLLKELDPINNLDKLTDRPILILHGGSDNLVSKLPQKVFYEEIKALYKDGANITMKEYEGLDHFVTTNMMEESSRWILNQFGEGR